MIWETEYSDAACLGVAIVSGASIGLFNDLEKAVDEMVTLKRKYVPNMKNHEKYRKMYAQYKQLYDDLCPMFNISAE